MFSKMIDYKLKSSLYKEKDQYILSVCMKQIPEDIKERVLGYGSEFAMKIHNDDKRAAYYSEFLEVIIRENAIEVLNNL